MALQSPGDQAKNPFQLPPSRELGLRDGATELERGAREDVPRTVVETGALAQVVGQRPGGEAGWARVRAEVWERSLRDAGLLPFVEDAKLEAPPALAAQLRAIREQLALVRDLEQRLGEDAEVDGQMSRSEHEGVVLLLCAFGVLAALAPSELRPFLAAALGIYGGRAAWRQWGPRLRVERDQLSSARAGLAGAVQSFLEQTWVAAIGDRVLESTPHAVYLHHRLMDLDAARGAGEARARELRGLIARIRATNQSLGQEQDDAETRRVQRQIDEIQSRLSLIDRLRADCSARSEAHLARLERQRVIAARRALSSRVSSMVDGDSDDASAQEIATIEVDIADLAARMRGLEVEAGSADADLRSVLEVAGAAGRGSIGRRRSATGAVPT